MLEPNNGKKPAVRLLTPEQSRRIRGLVVAVCGDVPTAASKLGLAAGTLYGVINGWRPNPEVRRALAAFLGVPVSKLFPPPETSPSPPPSPSRGEGEEGRAGEGPVLPGEAAHGP